MSTRDTKVTIVCAQCGDGFHPHNNGKKAKYCSRSCFALGYRKRLSTTCENCGEVFEYRPSEGQRRYCSQACNRTNWKGGIESRTWRADKDGYLQMGDTNHPIASPSGLLRQHWYVIYEAALDKDALVELKKRGATVHHTNGVRDDNGEANLTIRLPGLHPRGTSEDDAVLLLQVLGYTVSK